MKQTLTTTEELKHLASSDNANELTRRLARECLANREAQPVGFIEQSGLDYLQSGADADIWPEGGAGDIPLYTAPPAPGVPPEIPLTSTVAVEYVEGWNDCRAAMLNHVGDNNEKAAAKCECSSIDYCENCLREMLAQPVSHRYTLPDGFKLMPLEMTDEIGEAIAMEARCCGGIALCIYEAALAAAPEGESAIE
ncbi:TPA: hypothetical protein JD344_16930 [Serratia marcescens]|uniref:hypothetical protein n=1 Tax=Serratia TaxID=613 RepID=UPI001A34F1C9|nr:hypothetical protein [Serratia marcescens]HAU5742193.1 hypothetical protein [Serratia marcescens]HAU5746193.1 hypothetical protein [Serratia marcescens]HAU5758462.1 hypothetical protein [Serratia marcescens]HAU5765780.1 hypothetical protein [Serratia marcescens]